jgi:response regulator RpfG family c-di-GMP phosphodiesterase
MACTGVSGQDQRDRGLYECGIDVWLTKPIPPELLKTWVTKWKAEAKALEGKKKEVDEREVRTRGQVTRAW